MIAPRPQPPLAVGISECLTGARVRYDGDHKRDGLPHARELERLFEWRGFCPEVAIGMGVPRPPIRLVGDPMAPRAVRVGDPTRDFTDALAGYAGTVIRAADVELAGYVFTENSPSCGLYGVKVYAGESADPVLAGRGVYASALTRLLPELPVEDADRLLDDAIRESFVDRVFAYAHWSALRDSGLDAQALIEFHGCYEYLLMAHSVAHCGRAESLLSGVQGFSEELGERYLRVLLTGLARPATRSSHAGALLRLKGRFGDALGHARDAQLASQISAYRTGEADFQDVADALLEACIASGAEQMQNQVYLSRPGT